MTNPNWGVPRECSFSKLDPGRARRISIRARTGSAADGSARLLLRTAAARPRGDLAARTLRRSPREMVVVGVAEDAESVGMCPERLAQVRTLCRGYVDRGEKAFTQVRLERPA